MSNLLQNILDYLTALDSFGLDEETFMQIQQRIETISGYIQIAMDVNMGLSITRDIVLCAQRIVYDTENLLQTAYYFYSIGARASICVAAMEEYKLYAKFAKDLSDDYDKISEMFKNYKSGEELSLLTEMQRYAREYRSEVDQLYAHSMNKMRALYREENALRTAVANQNFRQLIIY